MNLSEAMAIAAIIGTADNACPVCVNALVDKLRLSFPMFKWTVAEHSTTVYLDVSGYPVQEWDGWETMRTYIPVHVEKMLSNETASNN